MMINLLKMKLKIFLKKYVKIMEKNIKIINYYFLVKKLIIILKLEKTTCLKYKTINCLQRKKLCDCVFIRNLYDVIIIIMLYYETMNFKNSDKLQIVLDEFVAKKEAAGLNLLVCKDEPTYQSKSFYPHR